MRILILVALLLPAMAWGQIDTTAGAIFPMQNGAVHFEKSETIDTINPQILFKKCKIWLSQTMDGSKGNLVDDKDLQILSAFKKISQTESYPAYNSLSKGINTVNEYQYKVNIGIVDNKVVCVVTQVAISSGIGNSLDIISYRQSLERQTPLKKSYLKKYLSEVDSNLGKVRDKIQADMNSLFQFIHT